MRLVLLPGLNGSGALFAPLLGELRDVDCHVLELPDNGPQDYGHLTEKLSAQLGDTPFVLLGESFSGPLAFRLALRQPGGLRGVIFAASFLTRPNAALMLFRHLPMPQTLATQPWLLRALCLGRTASDEVVQSVQHEVAQLDQQLLRARLQTLSTLQAPRQRLDLPCLQLWPRQDRLVSARAGGRLSEACNDIRQVRLDGAHFILQAQPQACARAIAEFMQGIGAG